MLARSKTLVLAICLFLIAFKVAASGIFVEAAIERVHQAAGASVSLFTQQTHDSRESADDKHHQVSPLNIMNHIMANVSQFDGMLTMSFCKDMQFCLGNDGLLTQNVPDPAFKPPKVCA